MDHNGDSNYCSFQVPMGYPAGAYTVTLQGETSRFTIYADVPSGPGHAEPEAPMAPCR